MFSLYEAVPQLVNAFYYTHDLPVATAVDTLSKSGLFTEVTEEDDIITLSRNGSDYKLKRGTVVVLQGSDSFSLVDDVTFFTQYAELITVEVSEFKKLVGRVDMLEKLLKVVAVEQAFTASKKKPTADKTADQASTELEQAPTKKKPTADKTADKAKKVEKEFDTPAATE